jgi:hypothetical protein
MSSYGPLIAALIALLGVAATVLVNDSRVRRQSRIDREDKYRSEARAKLAEVLLLVDDLAQIAKQVRKWEKIQEDRKLILLWASEFLEKARDLRTRLLQAHLLCQETSVRYLILDLNGKKEIAVERVQELMFDANQIGPYAGKEIASPFIFPLRADKIWSVVSKVAGDLHGETMEIYPPTVKERSLKAESRRGRLGSGKVVHIESREKPR